MIARKKVVGKTLVPPEKGVTVRMYHTGFGDCFLLVFRGKDGGARHMLIDCGVHHQYSGGSERMKLIAADIAEVTGKRLHIVAVTHEHTDHIYGFKYASEIFRDFTIDELWLAWTEDPANEVAALLKEQRGKKVKALQAAVARLKASDGALAARLEGILEFDSPAAVGAASGGTGGILKDLRDWSRKKPEASEDYRKPGEVLGIGDVKGVKCYVLAPPEDRDLIEELTDKDEMYSPLAALNEETAFMAALMAASGSGSPEDDRLFTLSTPFDGNLGIPEASAAKEEKFGEFFKRHYGFDSHPKSGPKWRRIDTDWLAAADQLALSINNYTNNTSLVLAFELTESKPRKVLLFAGDAQIGNWLSWQDVEWPGAGTGEGKITGAELLHRTVLYKVGHHGSVNATARRKGLEMMESAELMAMLPVDGKWAKEKQGWNHPEKAILDRLMDKTKGRVIRSDEIPQGTTFKKPDEATDTVWKEFLKNVRWDDRPERLWIEFTVR